MTKSIQFDTLDGIAVVGMAARVPGAKNVGQFWQNLRDGVESISFLTDQELAKSGVDPAILNDPNYVKAGALLDDIEWFDTSFFGYSAREAELIDPQQRLFLECAWEALETAGCVPDRYKGQIGVYAGVTENDYWINNLHSSRASTDPASGFTILTGNGKDYLATRVSYKLNLRGPSIVVQTACSTSLVATHLACQALLNGECDVAIAGGVAISVPQKTGYLYQDGMINSPDGHCRAFDVGANGTIFGSGLGVVVLKRLADAINENDTICAVIRGSAVNNDGALKIGYTAPSETGQAQVIAEALEIACVDPATVSYVETHGTGTPLGDPIEVTALTMAFRLTSDAKGFCAIGSVKSNIGHLNVAAGVISLIKTLLALKYKQIPASLHFKVANSKIDFANSPFYVNTKLTDWKTNGQPRRAGVSSFGIGGTNAHVVLEEAPAEEPSSSSRAWQLLLLSARTETALDTMTANLAKHLRENPDVNLAEVAHTLQVGRKVFTQRRMLVCRDLDDATKALETVDQKRVFSNKQERTDRPVAFMFTGQGSQYAGMAQDLYEAEPTFRAQVDLCCELLEPHLGLDLREMIYPKESRAEAQETSDNGSLNQTWLTQPALFVIEYAFAKLWMEWGIRPRAMIGHSIGEYVAGCLAGVFSLEEALALVAARGRLMQELPGGAMLSIALDEAQVRGLLGARLSIAAVNAPSMCVVSGPLEDIDALKGQLKEQGAACQRLHTSHGFHSAMMEPILEPFTRLVEKIKLHAPTIPYVSNVSGTWITPAQATDASYWARHLRQAVCFGEGVRELMKDPSLVLLEIGPGQTLTTFARRNLEKGSERAVLSSLRLSQNRKSDVEFILETLGRLWLGGVPIDWAGFCSHERRRRIPLPTYPFERQRYWVEPENPSLESKKEPASLAKRPDIADWFYVSSWKQAVPLVAPTAGEYDKRSRWLALVDGGGFGERIAQRLRERNQDVVLVAVGKKFVKENDRRYAIRPGSVEDYEALFAELNGLEFFPDKIIHLWTLSRTHLNGSALDTLETSQALGFYSLLYLAQAVGNQRSTGPLALLVVSNELFDVTGEEDIRPEKATILGPCKTIPQEYPNIACRLIDLDGLENGTNQPIGMTDRLLAEIMVDSANALVAYRRKRRWIQTFEPLPLTDPVKKQPRLRDGGVYLITGGLGGIGLALAEYLAQTSRAKLVLAGRSSLPDRDNWEQWLATHGEGDPVSHKLRKVKSLEALGAEVLVVTADVADLEQMNSVIERAKKRFGAIHAVIHAAGIAGGGVIQLKDPDAAAKVMSPKVKGTLVLDEVLKNTTLDFFVLCSSVLALTSRAGQVDYCGANAFLDAFAHYKISRDNSFTVSINWDGWEEVGMAVDSSLPSQARLIHPGSSIGREINHPLLDRLILGTPDRLIYRTDFRVEKHWVLNEHRILGTAVLPGTTYLEMARAAYSDHFKRERIEITDVYFLTPLMVGEDEQKEVFTVLDRDGEACDFRIISKTPSNGAGPSVWREHARGRIADLARPAAAVTAAKEIFKRLDNGATGLNEKEQINGREEIVYWGPRWQCVKALSAEKDEAFARLDLPEEFSADLEKLQLHPSLLDVATSLGVRYIGQDGYLPFSYERLEVHGPLSGKLNSHVKFDGSCSSGSETVTFDALITDQSGKLLVQIKGLSLKRVDDATALSDAGRNGEREPRPDHARLSEAEAQLYESLLEIGKQSRKKFEGILPLEGVAAFRRILALGMVPQVVVSVAGFPAVLDRRGPMVLAPFVEQASQQSSAGSAHARPNLESAYAAPQTDSEKALANIWQEVLGIVQVGLNDNFFELGGDSVIAVQMIARAKKAGFQLAPAQIFQHQTIAELAAVGEVDRRQQAEQVPTTDSNIHSQSSQLDDFGWTQGELDDIGRALRKSLN